MNKFSIVFIIFIVFAASFAVYKEFEKVKVEQYKSNIEYMPECSMPSIFVDGGILDTNSLLGKKYILNIFSTWCSHCEEAHKIFLKIKEDNEDIDMYAFVWNDNPEAIEDWLISKGNPYKFVGFDKSNDCFEKLNIKKVPHSFIISEDGKILYSIEGKIKKRILMKLIK